MVLKSSQFADADDAELGKQPRSEPSPGESIKRGRGRPSKASIESEIAGQLEALLKLMAMAWSMQDPICGPVLNNQSALIAQDLAKLAAKNKWARQYLTQTAQVGSALPLVMHMLPVFNAVRHHHIEPKLQEVREAQNGQS
jgi:hypothetical protein